tara:strand:- start:319 stop:486 length:168 start_codon:yes stop_codon:yes gene_type:complete
MTKALRMAMKSLPVVSSLAVGVGVTLALINKDKIEDKVADKLIARQITKEDIPLQ